MHPTEESLEQLVIRSTSYAGVGSRLTPALGLSIMEGAAEVLAKKGLLLRSGGAPGADMAFEWGCYRGNGRKEIFLPWRRFNGNSSPLFRPTAEAEEIAALCHPNWRACTPIARKLHARNCQQVCGEHLDDPVDFVLFWANERNGLVEGGTATAVYLARQLEIPTFNLRFPEIRQIWRSFVERQINREIDESDHPLSLINIRRKSDL